MACRHPGRMCQPTQPRRGAQNQRCAQIESAITSSTAASNSSRLNGFGRTLRTPRRRAASTDAPNPRRNRPEMTRTGARCWSLSARTSASAPRGLGTLTMISDGGVETPPGPAGPTGAVWTMNPASASQRSSSSRMRSSVSTININSLRSTPSPVFGLARERAQTAEPSPTNGIGHSHRRAVASSTHGNMSTDTIRSALDAVP
jgi:hypothetical protein